VAVEVVYYTGWGKVVGVLGLRVHFDFDWGVVGVRYHS